MSKTLLTMLAVLFGLIVVQGEARADWIKDVNEITRLMQAGDYAGAEKFSSASLASGPSGLLFSGTGTLVIHHWRGRARLLLGDFAGVAEDAEAIIRADSSFFPPEAGYALRGVAKALQGDVQGATQEFETVSKFDKSGMGEAMRKGGFHAERAFARLLTDDLEGADADLKEAIAIDYGMLGGDYMVSSKKAWAEMRVAIEKLNVGANSQAHAAFVRARTIFATAPGTSQGSDFVLAQLLVNKYAKQQARQVAVLEDGLLLQAQQQLNTGNRAEAFRLYVRAFVESGSSTTRDKALGGMSLIHPTLTPRPGLPEEARRFLVQSRGFVAEKNYPQAIELYDKALKIAPWWASAHFDKALLLEQMSRYALATQSMKHYLLLAPAGEQAREAQDKIYEWEPRLEREASGESIRLKARGVAATPSTSDCFIATAAYGSALDPHVATLRTFRDAHLLDNAGGRWFVARYYELSPPLADYIRSHEAARSVVRAGLTPLVLLLAYPWLAFAGFLAGCAMLTAGWLMLRRARCHA
ncbi:MAG: tetratricopeptide repeat protein [Rhodocyclaceae bacterium]|nr:tetratricopeptide repeat protein [Rhodocyclaceae bacterium]